MVKKEKTQDQTSGEKLEQLEKERDAISMKIKEIKEETDTGFWNRETGRSMITLGKQAIKGVVIISCIVAGIAAGNLAADALSDKDGISEV